MAQKTEVTKEEIYFRGKFMSLFIDIEFLLGDTLTTLLLDSKNTQKLRIHEYITPNLFFNDKIKLVDKILKSKKKNLHEKYKNEFNDLRDSIDLRNNFAHKRINIDINNKILNFIVVNNGRFTNNSNTFNELEVKYNKLIAVLKQLENLEKELG